MLSNLLVTLGVCVQIKTKKQRIEAYVIRQKHKNSSGRTLVAELWVSEVHGTFVLLERQSVSCHTKKKIYGILLDKDFQGRWEAATGASEIVQGKGHSNQVQDIAISGDTLYTVAFDDTIISTSLASNEYG